MQLALYSTGSSGVAATATELAAHPTAVIIDQSPSVTKWDATADVDDYERGAVTLAELPIRAKERIAAFKAVKRPGQRMPVVYASESSITSVVNALISGGVTSGVGLWVADWNWSEITAISKVTRASGPFPIVAVQYHNGPFYDFDVFSGEWLSNRSVKPVPFPPKIPSPPGQWLNARNWTWETASIAGRGLDGKDHVWNFDVRSGKWVRQSLPFWCHNCYRFVTFDAPFPDNIVLASENIQQRERPDEMNITISEADEFESHAITIDGKYFGNVISDNYSLSLITAIYSASDGMGSTSEMLQVWVPDEMLITTISILSRLSLRPV
jgi:hypothetical protein